MFSNSPFFVHINNFSRRATSGAWWVVMAPGLMLTLMALAIIVWPELLAYLVASVLLFVGISLTVWGWSLRQLERRQATTVYRIWPSAD